MTEIVFEKTLQFKDIYRLFMDIVYLAEDKNIQHPEGFWGI